VVVFQLDERIIVLVHMADSAILATAKKHQQQISQAIAKALGVKVAPQEIYFIAPGQIAKTSSGKLKRRAMAQAFLDGNLRYGQSRAQSASPACELPSSIQSTPEQEVYLEH
jgi:acyl-coenzyme A synthetase/AMP-(fatty) acid ligase